MPFATKFRSTQVTRFKMSLKPPQRRIHPLSPMGNRDELGVSDFPFSDCSSVVSDYPDAWVCPHCSYMNGDGRNASCAMCGTKNHKKVEEEKIRLQKKHSWRSLGSAAVANLSSSLQEPKHDDETQERTASPGEEMKIETTVETVSSSNDSLPILHRISSSSISSSPP